MPHVCVTCLIEAGHSVDQTATVDRSVACPRHHQTEWVERAHEDVPMGVIAIGKATVESVESVD